MQEEIENSDFGTGFDDIEKNNTDTRTGDEPIVENSYELMTEPTGNTNAPNRNTHESPLVSPSNRSCLSMITTCLPCGNSNKKDISDMKIIEEEDNLNELEVMTLDRNVLGSLLQYHITNEANLKPKDYVISILSIVTAASSLALYYNPARNYAGDDLERILFYEFCVLTANFGVGAWAASATFNSFVHKLPPDLRRRINEDYDKNKKYEVLKTILIAIASFLAASPYAFAANEPVPVRVLVGVSNWVMNYYAMNGLILKHLQFLMTKFSRSQQTKDYRKLLTAFNHVIEEVRYKVISSGAVPNDLKLLSQKKPKELLLVIADLAKAYDIEARPELTIFELLFRRWLPTTIGVTSTVGLIIYLIKTYEFLRVTSDSNSIILPMTGVISIPFLYVAMTFASEIFQKLADILACKSQKPLAFQLYPVTTLLTGLATALFVSGSFATIADFMRNDPYINNGPLKGQIDALVIIAAISAVIFNMYPNQRLGYKIIEQIARRYGGAKEKELAAFGLEMDAFLENVNNLMSPKKFAESLRELDNHEDKLKLLPLHGVTENVEAMLISAMGDKPVDMGDSSFLSSMTDTTKALMKSVYSTVAPSKYTKMNSDEKQRAINEVERKNADNALELKPLRSGAEISQPPRSYISQFWNMLPSCPAFCKRLSFYNPCNDDDNSDVEIEPMRDGTYEILGH